jgi:hypothetical protein
LPNFVLEQLVQSPQLQVESEDVLFDLVIDLIERDPNRKSIVKNIYFPGASPIRLINFFDNYSFEEVDFDLFESIKVRLFCNILQLDSFQSSRQENLLTFRSKEKIDEILELLQHMKNKSYIKNLSEF